MIGLSSLKDNKEIRNIEKYIRDINDNEIYLDKCFPHSFVEKYIITIIIINIKQANTPLPSPFLLQSHPPHSPLQQHLQQPLLHSHSLSPTQKENNKERQKYISTKFNVKIVI